MDEEKVEIELTTKPRQDDGEVKPEHNESFDVSPLHKSDELKHETGVEKANGETSVLAQDMFQIRSGTHSSKTSRRINKITIVLLVILGVIAGLMNGIIILLSALVSGLQGTIASYGGWYGLGFLNFLITASLFAMISASLCKFFSKEAAGSGLPEFKSLLASELEKHEYSKLVSFTILVTKCIGLILSSGCGLSVGSEGPLVHTAACIAYVLMSSNAEFEEILDSPALAKQIFAASAAIGISSTFNAPVGGLLFSVEVTSTFYLISNYWKSFLAAACGAVACYFFLFNKGEANNEDPLVVLAMTAPEHQFVKWEIILFFFMSIGLGYLSHLYLLCHQKIAHFLRPFNRQYGIATAGVVALISAFFIYVTGVFTTKSVSVLQCVSDIINGGTLNEMQRVPAMHPIPGLMISLLVRTLLTLLGTNVGVPAGIFMPVFLIGGIFGRIVGQLMVQITWNDPSITIYPATYAFVGAVAFASGITQTISVCMIAVELTGNIKLFLPALVAAVTGAIISKSRGLSVYDYGMLNKGLESFQLLLMDFGGVSGIKEIMTNTVSLIPAKNINRLTILKIMYNSSAHNQQVFPLVTSLDHHQLLGSIARIDIYQHMSKLFQDHNAEEILSIILKRDYMEEKDRIEKDKQRQQSRLLRKQVVEKMKHRVSDATHLLSSTGGLVINTVGSAASSIIYSDEEGERIGGHTRSSSIDTATGSTGEAPAAKRRSSFLTPRKVKYSPVGADIEANVSPPTPGNIVDSDRDSDSTVPASGMAGGGADKSTPSGTENVPSSPTASAEAVFNFLGHQAMSAVSFASIAGTSLFSSVSQSPTSADVSAKKKSQFVIRRMKDILKHPAMTDALRTALLEPLDLEVSPIIPINSAPFSIALQTPLEQVYVLFEMVRVPCVFVVEKGVLLGMIGRESILESLRKKQN